jgi:putative oxidoreductase
VSTYDDGLGNETGRRDDGLFYPSSSADSGNSTYNSSGRDPSFESAEEEFGFTDSGGGATSVLRPGGGAPASFGPSPFDDDPRDAGRWHGSADFGLFVLRLAVGGTVLAHGLQHMFGLFHGVGLHGFQAFVEANGYKYPTIMGVVAGGAELAGGGLLIVGLFTPLAAAAILGLLANVIVLKWKLGFFEPGYELELVLSGAAFALLFAGPGRASFDRPTPWFRRPGLNGFIFLIIGAAAAVVVLLVLRHHN